MRHHGASGVDCDGTAEVNPKNECSRKAAKSAVPVVAMELDPANGRNDWLLAAIRRDGYAANGMLVPSPDPDALLPSQTPESFPFLSSPFPPL